MSKIKKKIRVMHLIHSLGAGGAENGIINLANKIDREQFEISICSFLQKGSRKKHLKKDVKLFSMNKKTGNNVTLPFRLSKLFREWKPDIVHTHAWGTMFEGFIGAKLACVPIIVHGEHGTIEIKKRNRYFQRAIWHLFDAVLSVSVNHKKKLASVIEFPEEKIIVLKNGVDTGYFKPKPDVNVFDIKDKFIIGTIGRLVPVKNQALLINAFAELHKTIKDIHLIIVGEGPLEKNLQNLTKSLNISPSVSFTGRRFDIADVLNSFDLFVLPSLSEGMSNTILEAMACGIPAIATDVGGNGELIQHGETGLLIESDNLAELLKNILLIQNQEGLKERFSRRSVSFIEKHHSLPTMVEQYQNFYHQQFI